MKRGESAIQCCAIRIVQTSKYPLFLFSLSAADLSRVADVSRVSRDSSGRLRGYQRPEVKRHVRNIVEYLNGKEVLFPNSIILALSSEVVFKQFPRPKRGGGVGDAGMLTIPLPALGRLKPAWIVDGQQRALALSQCRNQGMPVPVSAFIADEVELQRDLFLRVNNTKPLPRGLITELLPEVSRQLPVNLATRKVPATLCDILSRDLESPFRGLIRRTSLSAEARRAAVITDNAVVKMIGESLGSPTGCLYPFHNIATGETDYMSVRKVLLLYWTAVQTVWPEAWGLSPSRSRLMHGAGIRSMGRVMDKVMSGINIHHSRAQKMVQNEVARLKSVCHWTQGHWGEEMGGMAWNEIQNTPQHIRLLSSVLIHAYMNHRRTAA